MKTIMIIFAGLIAQVDRPGPGMTAVLIDAMNSHIAELVMPSAALQNKNDVLSLGGIEVNGFVILPLEGAHITVDGTSKSANFKSKAYRASVPQLRKLVDGCTGPRKAVKDETPGGYFASFVQFRGGDLFPDTYLEQTLTFKDTGHWKDRCTACGVRYVADLTGDHATLLFVKGGAGHEILVNAGAKLLVRNRPLPDATSTVHSPHLFEIYSGCKASPPGAPGYCTGVEHCEGLTYMWECTNPQQCATIEYPWIPGQQEEATLTWPNSDCIIGDEP